MLENLIERKFVPTSSFLLLSKGQKWEKLKKKGGSVCEIK